jgi:hypothetical protein
MAVGVDDVTGEDLHPADLDRDVRVDDRDPSPCHAHTPGEVAEPDRLDFG